MRWKQEPQKRQVFELASERPVKLLTHNRLAKNRKSAKIEKIWVRTSLTVGLLPTLIRLCPILACSDLDVLPRPCCSTPASDASMLPASNVTMGRLVPYSAFRKLPRRENNYQSFILRINRRFPQSVSDRLFRIDSPSLFPQGGKSLLPNPVEGGPAMPLEIH